MTLNISSQNLPKFPADFCIQSFDKKNFDAQLELIEREMKRIYNLVMEQIDIMDAAVVSFKFNWRLSNESRRYILSQILERFPKIQYKTGSYVKDDCRHNSYANVDLAIDTFYGHQYIIFLMN